MIQMIYFDGTVIHRNVLDWSRHLLAQIGEGNSFIKRIIYDGEIIFERGNK